MIKSKFQNITKQKLCVFQTNAFVLQFTCVRVGENVTKIFYFIKNNLLLLSWLLVRAGVHDM